MAHKDNKRLTPVHKDFVNKYVCTRYSYIGLYRVAFFCEDEDIAFVLRVQDRNDAEAWGCVNMKHQLLVPFEYKKIFDYGRFLIAINSSGRYLYNKKGQLLYPIEFIRKTEHKAYRKVFEPDEYGFRICIRKMAISKSRYLGILVMKNGLAYLENEINQVGAILFSKLKLPFEYRALSEPQNGYMLGIKAYDVDEDGEQTYDCLLIKVRNKIQKEDSIHPTGITLFSHKTWDDVLIYFEDKKQFEKDCNSIICYNQQVSFDADTLNFFPSQIGLPEFPGEEEEDDEEDYYDPWSRENYSYAEAMYDALGGEIEAIWNLD